MYDNWPDHCGEIECIGLMLDAIGSRPEPVDFFGFFTVWRVALKLFKQYLPRRCLVIGLYFLFAIIILAFIALGSSYICKRLWKHIDRVAVHRITNVGPTIVYVTNFHNTMITAKSYILKFIKCFLHQS